MNNGFDDEEEDDAVVDDGVGGGVGGSERRVEDSSFEYDGDDDGAGRGIENDGGSADSDVGGGPRTDSDGDTIV